MKKLFNLLLVVLILITSLSACGGNSDAVPDHSGEEVVQHNNGTNQVEELPSDESASLPGDEEYVVDTPSIPAGPATIEDFTTQLDLTPYYTEEGFDLDAVAEYFGFTKGPEKPDDGHITYLRQVDGITCSASIIAQAPIPSEPPAQRITVKKEPHCGEWNQMPLLISKIPRRRFALKTMTFLFPKALKLYFHTSWKTLHMLIRHPFRQILIS